MKCDKLKSLWVYCRDINEDVDDEFLKFAPKNGYEELVEKSEVDEAIAELKEKLEKKEDERKNDVDAVLEGCRKKQEEVDALKAKLGEKDKEIAELKQEIERLKQENEMVFVGLNLRSPTNDGRFI